MKLRLYADEWYPVWSIATAQTDMGTTEVDVQDETAERWKRVVSDFNEVQDEMRKAVKDSPK